MVLFKFDILGREAKAAEAIKNGDFKGAATLNNEIGLFHERRHEYEKAAKSFRREETCYKSEEQKCISAHQNVKALAAKSLADIAAEKAKAHEPHNSHKGSGMHG